MSWLSWVMIGLVTTPCHRYFWSNFFTKITDPIKKIWIYIRLYSLVLRLAAGYPFLSRTFISICFFFIGHSRYNPVIFLTNDSSSHEDSDASSMDKNFCPAHLVNLGFASVNYPYPGVCFSVACKSAPHTCTT
jgi:hypothetical protein